MGFADELANKNRGSLDYYSKTENFEKKLDEPGKTSRTPEYSKQVHENAEINKNPPVNDRFRNASDNIRSGFVREVAHRVVFMDGGRIVEVGKPEEVFERPRHDRTKAFLSKVLRA